MRTLCTLFTLFIAFSSFAQVQLDSIDIFNVEYQETEFSYKFEYDNGKLSRVLEYSEGELFLTADLEYNAEGKIEKSTESFFGEDKIFDVTFNSDGNMDSLTIFTESNGLTELLTYEYDGTLLMKNTLFQFGGSEFVEVATRNYSYDGNTVTIALSSPFGGAVTYEEVYDNDDRIIKWSELAAGSVLVDTFYYELDCMIGADRKNSLAGDYSGVISYECEQGVDFSMILNPSQYFVFIGDYYGDITQHYFFPMLYGSKVNSSTGTYLFAEETTEWFYNIINSNDETVSATPFSVYPNPTVENLQMELDEILESYTIYDLSGAIVKSAEMSDNQLISVSELNAGSYTITTKSKDDKYFFAQFVKN